MRLVMRVDEALEKSRRVRWYTKTDPKTGKLIYVKEHTDRRDPAQQQLPLGRETLHLTPDEPKPARKKTAPAAGVQMVLPVTRQPTKSAVSEEPIGLFAWAAQEKARVAAQRAAEEARLAAEAAKQRASSVSPADQNISILHDLLTKKGMQARRGTTEAGKSAIEIFGDTYGHLAQFRTLKGRNGADGKPLVFGQKNHRGYFAWWTTDAHIGDVITFFGGKPYAGQTDDSGHRPGTDTPVTDNGGQATGRDGGVGTGPGLDRSGLLPASTAGVRSGPPDAGGDRQKDTNVREGTSRPRRGFSDYTIAELMSVTPPAPKATLDSSLTDILMGTQSEDVRLMADAFQRGERGFLLGNGTGSGKTYSALGAIKQLKPKRALIVVPNQAIAEQWKEASEGTFAMPMTVGVPKDGTENGLYVTTYAQLRKEATANGLDRGKWGMVIYDEAHRELMKLREGRQTARLAANVAEESDFTIYSTATPVERPYDAFYLFPLNLWPRRRNAFHEWAADHGVRWDTEVVPTRFGRKEVSKPKFVGSARGKAHDMLKIRAEILSQGKGVFRELQVDQPMSTAFHSVPVEGGEYSEQVTKALKALDGLPEGGIFAAVRVNITKRLLDYVKLEEGVKQANELIQGGKRVAVFVSNVSPFSFAMPDDAEEIKGLGSVAEQVRQVFRKAGLTGELPSPVDALVKKLQASVGENAVAGYTGEVSAGKRSKIKKAFQAGELKAIVATIAAGGTGLSLHDTVGDAPRAQVNIGLPWSGKDFQQLIGRTYRLGTKSPVEQRFILASHPGEQRIASIVAGKVESMGATVKGIAADKNAEHLAHFSVLGAFDPVDEDETETLHKSIVIAIMTNWSGFSRMAIG